MSQNESGVQDPTATLTIYDGGRELFNLVVRPAVAHATFVQLQELREQGAQRVCLLRREASYVSEWDFPLSAPIALQAPRGATKEDAKALAETMTQSLKQFGAIVFDAGEPICPNPGEPLITD